MADTVDEAAREDARRSKYWRSLEPSEAFELLAERDSLKAEVERLTERLAEVDREATEWAEDCAVNETTSLKLERERDSLLEALAKSEARFDLVASLMEMMKGWPMSDGFRENLALAFVAAGVSAADVPKAVESVVVGLAVESASSELIAIEEERHRAAGLLFDLRGRIEHLERVLSNSFQTGDAKAAFAEEMGRRVAAANPLLNEYGTQTAIASVVRDFFAQAGKR